MSWLRLLADTARGSLGLWQLAIWIPLIAVIPEFLQHIAEVKLGMFESREAFRALAAAPERMAWGYLKVGGLVAAWLVTAWFWFRREGARPDWGKVGVAVAINVAATMVMLLLDRTLPKATAQLAGIVLSIATLPLLAYLMGALAGDAGMTLRRSFTAGWLNALRMIVLTAAGFVVLQWLHGLNHKLALGQPDGLVWALMVWDSLIVGLMATWLGTAMHRGYRGVVFAKR
ncbi:MAG: hypothetical protein J0M19_09945 [Sphingomonadales bacterium]|nr:hypothetical protein [Sphingomonadales bacterium]